MLVCVGGCACLFGVFACVFFVGVCRKDLGNASLVGSSAEGTGETIPDRPLMSPNRTERLESGRASCRERE